jgi:CDP-glucose 4,6-dehydratase
MFWRDKRVLVTGHTGFKGSWLSLWLERSGAQVIGYAMQPPSTPSLFETAQVASGITSFHADVRDLRKLERTITETRPEVVFHLAAQSLVRHSYTHPVETFATNVMGTVNLLEAVRSAPTVRAVVIATSDKCYENRQWLRGYRETDALGGYDPYSASKGAAEIVTAAYRRSFFPPERYDEHRVAVASVRAGNVIGGGDWGAEKLVPDIVRAFARRAPVFIRNPQATRPWQHVLDALHGYMLLAERISSEANLAGAWNFGPSERGTKPVAWIVEHFANQWGDDARWQHVHTPAPYEAVLLKLDSSKARKRLGWAPKLDLPTALEWTVDWYKAHYAGADVRPVTVEQIERYQALLP